MGPKGADGPCNFMGHMGLMGHMRQFLSAVATTPSTADCRLPTAHCPLRFRPVRPVPSARGATPGHRPNEGVRPVRAALRCGPGNAPSTLTSRHATSSCRGAFVAVGIHIGNRGPRRQINGPRKARGCTPSSHRTRSVLLRAALTGRKLQGATGPGISCQADGAGLTGRKHSWAVARNLRRPTTLSTSQLPANNDQ
jgi:hypothetical protein